MSTQRYLASIAAYLGILTIIGPTSAQQPATVSSLFGLTKSEFEAKCGPPKRSDVTAKMVLIDGKKTRSSVKVCEYDIPDKTGSIAVAVTFHGAAMIELTPQQYFTKSQLHRAITDLGLDGGAARLDDTYNVEEIGGLAEPWHACWFNVKEKQNTWHILLSTQEFGVTFGPSGAHRSGDDDFKNFMSIDDQSVFPKLHLTMKQYKQVLMALAELRQKHGVLETTSRFDTPEAIDALSKAQFHLVDSYNARLEQILTDKQYWRYMALHYGKKK